MKCSRRYGHDLRSGVPTKFSTTIKVYSPANFRIILSVFGNGGTLAMNKTTSQRRISHRGLTSLCSCVMKREVICVYTSWMPSVMTDESTTCLN
jgi:hypothetical protein